MRYFSALSGKRAEGIKPVDVPLVTRVPRVFDLFDWVLHKTSTGTQPENYFKRNNIDPSVPTTPVLNVLSLPDANSLAALKEWMQGIPALAPGECRTLVTAGGDTRLSKLLPDVQNIWVGCWGAAPCITGFTAFGFSA